MEPISDSHNRGAEGLSGLAISSKEPIVPVVGSRDFQLRDTQSDLQGTQRTQRIRWIRRIGVAVFLTQFIGLVIWSREVYNHFALSYDFATYAQAVWQIWHGHLYPYSPVLYIPLWGNGGQALVWLLALITLPFHSAILLLWLQDVAIAGIGLALFWWITELFDEQKVSPSWIVWLAAVSIVAIAANPWIYWSATFDIHTETFCTFFFVMAARALYRERWKSLVLWSVLVASGGLVECTYLVALGLTALLVGKRYRRVGAILVVAPLAYFLLLDGPLQGAQLPPPGIVYGYLAGNTPNASQLSFTQVLIAMLTHPLRVVKQFWIERSNIWSNIATGGVIGIFNRWAISISVIVLATNILSRAFAAVPFQNLPVSIFVTLGSVMFLISWLNKEGLRKRLFKRLVIAVSSLMLISALGWTLIWSSRLETQWFHVSNGAISVLSKTLATIPNSDEVVVSQGISGDFSLRSALSVELKPQRQTIALTTPQVWFVIAPTQGIEVAPPAFSYSLIQQLVSQDGATLILATHRIYVLRLNVPDYGSNPPPTLTFGVSTSHSLGGWMLAGPAGRPVTTGPLPSWHAASTGAQGYVTAYAYWGESPGSYQVDVKLLTFGPVNVEVWDTTDNQLLLRRSPPSTNGQLRTFSYQVTALASSPPTAFSGWGPFQILPVEPSAQNVLEVRVWSPGNETVDVYHVGFHALAN